MRFRIVESLRHDCVFSRAFGTYAAEHIRRANRETEGLRLVRGGAPIVNDMRSVGFGVATSEVMLVRHLPFSPHTREGRRRIAFVAGSALSFGMLRVMATLRDYDGQMTNVFHEFAEAFAWIERPGLGDSLPDEVDLMLGEPADVGDGHPGAVADGRDDAFEVTVGQI